MTSNFPQELVIGFIWSEFKVRVFKVNGNGGISSYKVSKIIFDGSPQSMGGI